MAELGAARRYTYWSDGSVQRVADNNGIRLEPAWRLRVRSPSAGLVPQAEPIKESRRPSPHDKALRIEGAIGQLAVEDSVTPPPCSFAKGVSRMTFAAYKLRGPAEAEQVDGDKGVILRTRVMSSDGTSAAADIRPTALLSYRTAVGGGSRRIGTVM
jgi:hypothetical protein